MRRPITVDEFGAMFDTVQHSAFRLELQTEYLQPEESEPLRAFLAGTPDIETEANAPWAVAWYDRLRRQTADGVRWERVRVQEDPPTDYQRWERWAGAWNYAAGEQIRYMTRERAHEVGLLPAAGTNDWWLFDSNRLMLMPFDGHGVKLGSYELITDDAEMVAQACAWRDVALHYSVLDTTPPPAWPPGATEDQA